MPDVLIHHCTLRLVRRSGWNWGADPQAWVNRLVRSVPALLEKKLAALLPDDADAQIAAPLTLRIPIRTSDLLSVTSDLSPSFSSDSHNSLSALDRNLETALRDALQSALPSICAGPHPTGRSATAPEPPNPALPKKTRDHAVQRLLFCWHKRSALEQFLAATPLHDLETWHNLLMTAPACFDTPLELAAASTLAENLFVFCQSKMPSRLPASPPEILRLRIRLVIEAIAHFQISSPHPALCQTLDRIMPLANGAAPAAPPPSQQFVAAPVAPALQSVPSINPANSDVSPAAQPIGAASPPRLSESWVVHIPCVIPFLLLRPLASIGFFDAVSVALRSAKIPSAAPLLAASLAYKVLDVPDHGWLRPPASQQTAAAFAGLRSPIDESHLTEIARQIAPHVGLLERLISDSLFAGHVASAPFVLCRANVSASTSTSTSDKDPYLLLDSQGCFPIHWSPDPASVSSLLSRATTRDSVLCVAPDASEPALLHILSQAGILFVVSVAPTRGEHWQRVPLSRSSSVWTNHPDPSTPDVIRAALELPQASEEAATLWQQIGLSRISAVRASSPALDRALTIAAATALGTIAWELWRHRGRTTPQLIFERFAELDAYIQVSPASVQVRLPLGRRHQELFAHGLLAPIDDIPWLNGRRVEFLGG